MIKQCKGFLPLLLCGAIITGIFSGCGPSSKETAPVILDTVRGMMVHTWDHQDFPSTNGLSSRELKPEINQMLEFAQENQLNTLFFEARPACDALYRSDLFPTSASWMESQGKFTLFGDLLEQVVSQASQKGIQVFGVIDPFYVGTTQDTLHSSNPAVEHPEWTITIGEEIYLNPQIAEVRQLIVDGALEVAENYGVAGIVYHNLSGTPLAATTGYSDAVSELVAATRQQLDAAGVSCAFGVSMDGAIALEENNQDLAFSSVTQWTSSSLVDFVQPIMTRAVGDDEDSYQNLLALWQNSLTDTQVELYIVHQLNRLVEELAQNPDGDAFELNYQLYINSLGHVDGTVIDSYKAAREDPHQIAANMMTLYSSNDILGSEIDLSLPKTFAITRPTQRLVTSYAKYFITGISDPDLPLTLDGEEVERFTKSGLFGVLVDVPYGTNTYTFQQGEDTQTVTIVRNQPSTGGTAIPITSITQSSMFPATAAYATLGETFTLRCVAPSGASVTATVGGQTVSLSQVAATASSGIPATFTGEITLESGYSSDEVTKIGTVTYTLTYGGVVNRFTSSGELYVVGQNASLVMEVSDYIAGVTVDETPENEGNFLNTLRQGAREYVVGQTDEHFVLQSGGTIRKSAVTLLEGDVALETTINTLHFSSDDRSETFTIPGAAHALARAQRTPNGLAVTIYNASGQEESLTTNSTLFDAIEKKVEDNAVTYYFTLKDGTYLWGYDISYQDDNLLIYCRKTPVLSSQYGKPLQGISVVLDPGHGGYDPGALGVAGTMGPMEREVNLAVAYATKQRLEQLGATVTMTLTGQEEDKVVLFDRMKIADAIKPDFFISIHHNSIGENSDANSVSGTYVYYFDEGSQMLAENIVNRVSEAVDRPNKGAEQSYYVVTKMTYCPSVLAEIGFMVSPSEYESLLDPLNIYKTACAISGAVVSTVENPVLPAQEEQAGA